MKGPKMALYAVKLVAEDIQVTANGLQQAKRYAQDDAVEFIRQWNYQRSNVELADSTKRPATDRSGASLELVVTDDPGPGPDRIWTFEAQFTICIEAPDAENADAMAREFLQKP